MSVLLDVTLARTLATVEADLLAAPAIVADVGATDPALVWLFETGSARRAVETRLAARGVRAMVRSAYKPLLHAFLEEIELDGVESVEIRYPVVTGVAASRFALECYPLDALLAGRALVLEPLAERALDTVDLVAADGTPTLHYEVVLQRADGERDERQVSVPARWCEDATGRQVLRSCGWRDGVLATDLETVFDRALETVGTHPWPVTRRGPFFDRLTIEVRGPFEDVPLALDGEALSLAEAMHEELYFGLLERFARLLGLPVGTRELRPGQIVPVMTSADTDTWHLKVTSEAVGSRSPPQHAAVPHDGPAELAELAEADRALQPARMLAHLEALGGQGYAAASGRGRAVHGCHVRATRTARAGETLPTVMLSAGQHANEATAPVGVLRAARELQMQGLREFAVTPLLNPDGYALFLRLCERHPSHMHHAARYTARGDDLECGDPALELGALLQARALTAATLHVNCHGYPSHEWTRPFSGYLPRGFELWTIPKGFFLIVRHARGLRDQADRVIDACVAALNDYPPVMAINAEQLARYVRYVPDHGIDIRSGVPVYVAEVEDPLVPLTLITEAPDETVVGERFRVLQEAQRRVVLAAVAAHVDWVAEPGALA